MGTLCDVGEALGASAPVWDLPLPGQLLKAWRWAAKRVGQTTAGEMFARLPCATVSASTRACCTMRKGLRRQRARGARCAQSNSGASPIT